MRTARICCQLASGCSGRLAADQLPVADCHVSTVPSLLVSRPNCAFRFITLLTAAVRGCTVGSRLWVRSVWLEASTVYAVCPNRAGSPGVAAWPRLTSEPVTAPYVAVV